MNTLIFLLALGMLTETAQARTLEASLNKVQQIIDNDSSMAGVRKAVQVLRAERDSLPEGESVLELDELEAQLTQQLEETGMDQGNSGETASAQGGSPASGGSNPMQLLSGVMSGLAGQQSAPKAMSDAAVGPVNIPVCCGVRESEKSETYKGQVNDLATGMAFPDFGGSVKAGASLNKETKARVQGIAMVAAGSAAAKSSTSVDAGQKAASILFLGSLGAEEVQEEINVSQGGRFGAKALAVVAKSVKGASRKVETLKKALVAKGSAARNFWAEILMKVRGRKINVTSVSTPGTLGGRSENIFNNVNRAYRNQAPTMFLNETMGLIVSQN